MKKHITPFNDKNQKHGYWERYHDEHTTNNKDDYGKLYYKCIYHNGIEVGYDEVRFYEVNKTIHKTFYIR